MERKYTLQLDLNIGMAKELSTLRFPEQRSSMINYSYVAAVREYIIYLSIIINNYSVTY